jgi:hypothetical protein
MIPNPYYLGNLPLIFSNALGLAAYPFSNMVSTKNFAIGGNQGVQAFVMTFTITVPIGWFYTKNPVPYFQPPTQNPP